MLLAWHVVVAIVFFVHHMYINNRSGILGMAFCISSLSSHWLTLLYPFLSIQTFLASFRRGSLISFIAPAA